MWGTAHSSIIHVYQSVRYICPTESNLFYCSGIGAYLQENSGPPRVLTNNALITPSTASSGSRLRLQCVSNSTRSASSGASSVGDVIVSDGFAVAIGGTYNNQVHIGLKSGAHGYLRVLNTVSGPMLDPIDASSQGVYTCQVYDANDNVLLINFGIYPNGFNSESSVQPSKSTGVTLFDLYVRE